MKRLVSTVALTLAVTLVSVTFVSAQQDKSMRPSPPGSADCKFSDGKSIKTEYSSPRAKGRKIFGEESEKAVVPYGKIWRTGANEATTFVTETNVTVGGKAIPAGSYTLFTIPMADKWTLIVNKKNAEWGIPYKYEADELARVDMKVSKTDWPVENFTIAFDQSGSKCIMRMEWENTRASVEITK